MQPWKQQPSGYDTTWREQTMENNFISIILKNENWIYLSEYVKVSREASVGPGGSPLFKGAIFD